MARFSKFKFLFTLKLNCNGVNFMKKYQNLVISKSWNEIKVWMNAKIEFGNKIGQEMKIKKSNPGWVDGCKSRLKDYLQQ